MGPKTIAKVEAASDVKTEPGAGGIGIGVVTDVRLVTALTALLHNDCSYSSAVQCLSKRFGKNIIGRETLLRQCYYQWRTESEGNNRAGVGRSVEVDGEVLEEVFEDALQPSTSNSGRSSGGVKKEKLPRSSVQMLLSPEFATFYGGLSATKEQGLAAVHAHIERNQLQASDSKVIACDPYLGALFQKQSMQLSEVRAAVAAHMRPVDDLDGSKKRKRNEAAAVRKAAKAEVDRLNPPPPKAKKERKAPTPAFAAEKEKKVAVAAKKKKVAKKDKKLRAANPNSGLNHPQILSEGLAGLLGQAKLSRAQCMKAFWDYVKSHDLQYSGNKKVILMDDAMKVVFSDTAEALHRTIIDSVPGGPEGGQTLEENDPKSIIAKAIAKAAVITSVMLAVPDATLGSFVTMLEVGSILSPHLTKGEHPATPDYEVLIAEVDEEAVGTNTSDVDMAAAAPVKIETTEEEDVSKSKMENDEPQPREVEVEVKREQRMLVSLVSAAPVRVPAVKAKAGKINLDALKAEPWKSQTPSASEIGIEGEAPRYSQMHTANDEDVLVHGNGDAGSDSDGGTQWYS